MLEGSSHRVWNNWERITCYSMAITGSVIAELTVGYEHHTAVVTDSSTPGSYISYKTTILNSNIAT